MKFRREIIIFLCCLVVLLAAEEALSAWPVSLNIIPIADTLPSGGTNLGFSVTVTSPFGERDTFNLIESEFGIGGRSEFGIDPAFGNDAGTLVNGKFRFRDESRLTPAAAIGIQNIAANISTMPYLTACKTFSVFRLHFGTAINDGSFRAMFGIEKHFGALIAIQSDYISGPGNWLTYGIAIGGPKGLNLNVASLIGNSDSSGSGYTVDLEWAGNL